MGSLYLVRHGETEWNRTGRIQGHTDVALNQRGRRQIEALAARLAGRDFSAAYSSDLSRTLETAEIVLKGRQIPLVMDTDLREFSYGEWEGLTVTEIEAQSPNAFALLLGLENNSFAAPGGENSAQVLDRVRRFCARIENLHDANDDLLIVAHGGTLRALIVRLLALPDDSLWKFQLDRASLSVVRSHTNGRVLELWNDTSHLATV